MPDFSRAQFLVSAYSLDQLPADTGAEAALAGRSNAGKSTALNKIVGRGIARASKTPGRTQAINVFTLDEQRRLADLPGYGYAQAPQAVRVQWQARLVEYLERRRCLRGLLLVVDSRRGLMTLDETLLEGAREIRLPVHILLSKADKLSRHQASVALRQLKKRLDALGVDASTQLFSAPTAVGIEEARAQLARWLGE